MLQALDRTRIGIGCMRLSTERDRDEQRAVAALHAALDAGVDLLDTADAYCWDEGEAGHNERLIARALSSWNGDRSRVMVATKGGLTRPAGAWAADGRARHLAAACEASRKALGVERIALYQLHAPDPRTPLTTSVRALASLRRDGLVEAIGLCNVNLGQLQRAREIAEIDSVQLELSPWRDDEIRSGVIPFCLANGIRVLAYRPLGGVQRRARALSEPSLLEVAARHAATPFEIALAWLRSLSPLILPIPGPTRVETAGSCARAGLISLTEEDRALLDERFPARGLLTARPRAPRRSDGEVVLVMGLPGAGKSTLAERLVFQGYRRLNRDERGGSLAALLPELDRLLAEGGTRVVLDNTYISRKARAGVLEVAARHGLPVRCLWLSTSLEEAQVNATWRIVSRFGRLPDPTEGLVDPALLWPNALFRLQRALEPPDPAEGFASVEEVPFVREPDPSRTGRALLLWCDGVLRRGAEVFTDRARVLRRYQEDGWRLLAIAWQPVAGDLTEAISAGDGRRRQTEPLAEGNLTAAEVEAAFARMRERFGLEIEFAYCPHGAGPPVCWCRKPLPGLGVLFMHRHRLDPARCLYVGAGPQDPGFARRLGFGYRDASDFFDT